MRTASLIPGIVKSVILTGAVAAGLLLGGCGGTSEEEAAVEETPEETIEETTEATAGESTTQQETTTATSDSEQAEVEVEAAPLAQAATPPLSNGESQRHDGHTPSQELGPNEAGQDVSNTPAISSAESIVFFPGGSGATYSCTGGPPFVFDHGSMGNCAVRQIGPPAGLVCDVPTTITFVHDMHRFVAAGSLCYSGTVMPAAPAQAQTYPFGTEPAPYSPAT